METTLEAATHNEQPSTCPGRSKKRNVWTETPVCNPTSVATVELMDLVDAPFPDANRIPDSWHISQPPLYRVGL